MKRIISLLLIIIYISTSLAEVEIVNNNIPYDDIYLIEDYGRGYEYYSGFDDLGRAGVAYAYICIDTMPMDQERPTLTYKPTGWIQKKYDCIKGKWLYNRGHLIAWCLTAEGDNKYNLVTLTRDCNQVDMYEYEMQIRDYIYDTDGAVLYRVTPEFEGEELVCRSVRIEAVSLDESICFHVRIYNVQDRIEIDYITGESYEKEEIK